MDSGLSPVGGRIRGLTNRIGGAIAGGIKLLRGPTVELAEYSAIRLAGTTLTGIAVSTRGMLAMETVGKRAIIMADDMAVFKPFLAGSTAEAGFYDIVIHGDPTSFYVLEKGVWKTVSARSSERCSTLSGTKRQDSLACMRVSEQRGPGTGPRQRTKTNRLGTQQVSLPG